MYTASSWEHRLMTAPLCQPQSNPLGVFAPTARICPQTQRESAVGRPQRTVCPCCHTWTCSSWRKVSCAWPGVFGTMSGLRKMLLNPGKPINSSDTQRTDSMWFGNTAPWEKGEGWSFPAVVYGGFGTNTQTLLIITQASSLAGCSGSYASKVFASVLYLLYDHVTVCLFTPVHKLQVNYCF